MNIASIIDGIGGFAGGLAGALKQQQGQSELGDALSALFGGGQSGGGSSMGGGSSQPPTMIPLLSGSGQGQGGAFQGRTDLGLPTAAGGGMGAGPLAAQLGGASTQPGTAQPPPAAMNGGNYGYAAPQGSQQPPQGQGVGSPVGATQQAGSPPGGQGGGASSQIGRGALSLPSLVAAIKQQHPNISGVQLARVVEKAIPLLSMEGLQQYRGVSQQLQAERMQDLQADRQDRSADRKQGMKDRMQMSSDRIQAQTERQQEGLKQKVKLFDETMDYKKARGIASDLRAAIKDKLEATNHEIQMQYSLDDDQKAELYKKAQADAKAAEDELNRKLEERKAGGKTSGENTQKNNEGAQTATPKDGDEQKAAYKKQAKETMAQHPEWTDKIRAKYKELTGDDLGD